MTTNFLKEKSLYDENNLGIKALTFLLSFIMIGVSLYLTNHYFELKFPTGLESGSLCNINSFFSCDKTTLSPLGNILSVPVSLFGIIIGAITLFGFILSNRDYERSNYFLLIINAILSVLLLGYSLIVLKGLCLLCTVYYLCSFGLLAIFYKKSEDFKPQPFFLLGFLVPTLIAFFLMKNHVNTQEKAQSSIAESLIKQYYSLPVLGQPSPTSEFLLANNPTAPIKLAIFSDFQCPACKMLSEQLHTLIKDYAGNIHVEYYFYPLDIACNPSMKNPLHNEACQAAYIASCLPQKFGPIHDEIFKNQNSISSEFLNGIAKRENVEACAASPETKNKVVSLINAATPFNVQSTPTFLVNGVKIEGVLPLDQIKIILNEILKRQGK